MLASVPEWAGGASQGELDVDFFGGQQPSTGGRTFPLIRLRRAFAELTWQHVAIFAGQESPPIAEVNPSSLASIGFPEFAGAGNLWLWIPQIRVQGIANLGQSARLGIEVAALAPTSGDAQTAFLTQPDIAERSSRPYLRDQVQCHVGRQPGQGEVSVGGHYGWLAVGRTGGRTPEPLALSIWTPLAPHLELRAEAFTGQALAGSGRWWNRTELRAGQRAGRDGRRVGAAECASHRQPGRSAPGSVSTIPDDGDLDPATARLRNLAFEGHVAWRLRPIVVGGELRRIRTRYGPGLGDVSATQLNLAAGFEF